MRRVIAGDVGGTKTLLRCVEASGEISAEQRLESAAFPAFDALLAAFLQRCPGTIDAACFAVAGPVLGGRADLTNLRWLIDEAALEKAFGIGRVLLINDFYAIALGVPLLSASDLVSLHGGQRDRTAPMAVLGAGTGLGQAVVIHSAGGWTVIPGEGGHADFAPQDEEQVRLLLALQKKYGGRVSWERVLSGMGLQNIYEFLTGRIEEPAAISRLASKEDDAAVRTMRIFVDAYGAEAGNMGLRVLARGGVFLAGGIATKNLPFFSDGVFMEAFVRKGRFRSLMETIPVDVIADQSVGLLGAVEQARRV
ncbi:MAG TPA: glucokinase [Thermoanaerobaculia bacterium]|nr:glucokinase [Thermoanaerobaculia bacterium]